VYEFLRESIGEGTVLVHHQGYRAALARSIDRAEKAVRVAAYVTAFRIKKEGDPVGDLVKALRRKKESGLDVAVILDGPKKGASNYNPAMMFLYFLGRTGFRYAVNLRAPTLHMKVVIIDERKCFVGSHNLTRSSVDNPLDCTVEIRDPGLVRKMIVNYELLFREITGGKSF